MKRIFVAEPSLSGNEAKYVAQCMESGWISSQGEFVDRFERDFAKFCNSRFAVSCSNGTTALHLAMLALGIGPDDEVVVPALTYVATANAVAYCGAEPVFIDSEALTLNLDPELLEHAITPRTKAIIPVHLFGHPANMTAINEIAGRHGIPVVEDAAEAHGASVRGRRVGSLGTMATFSFYGNKIITTGEGGMVTTDDEELNSRLRLFRGQGVDPQRKFWHPVVGYNYRLTNVACAIGVAQLERVDELLAARRELAGWYNEALAGLEEWVETPSEAEWASNVWWMYNVRLRGASGAQRDAVMQVLATKRIETRPIFYPIPAMPPYSYVEGVYPVAARAAAEGISLPTHTNLTQSDIERVVCTLKEALVATLKHE